MFIAVPSFPLGLLGPLLLQTGMVGLAALVAGLFGDLGIALAVLYGGGVAIANSALLFWRWHKGLRDFHCDAGKHVRSFYRSFMERFFVVMILLVAGFYWLGDRPLALLAGFVVGQMALMLASLTLRERT
jgi:F0F1-type ATP synthase assembly protein I